MELLFRDDAYLAACDATVTAVTPEGLCFDRTVFYPEGGGQPGDIGRLIRGDGSVVDLQEARKSAEGDEVLHPVGEGAALPEVGETVRLEIDWARRYRHMRTHSCLHLLCAAVSGDVTGGQVGEGRGRLDFNLPDGPPDKEQLAETLNRLMAEDHPIRPRWITDAELAAQPDLVRTLSVKPPSGSGRVRLLEIEGVDLQPCGGTHVRRTGEIGRIEVGKIENKGRQNRRINLRLVDL